LVPSPGGSLQLGFRHFSTSSAALDYPQITQMRMRTESP
jgi:hypothetical protein